MVFIAVVISSGWIGVLVDSLLTEQPEGETLGMGVWLVLPLVTAIVILLFSKNSRKEMGLKPNFNGNLKWYAAACQPSCIHYCIDFHHDLLDRHVY